jgi:hypothetical protein
VVTPPSPIAGTTGRLVSGEWVQEFDSVRGWRYVLEASADLTGWSELPVQAEGTGERLTLRVPAEGAANHRFFRVKAVR